jgi:hypothetical protein
MNHTRSHRRKFLTSSKIWNCRRIKQNHCLLDNTVKVTAFSSRQKDFEQFFIEEGEFSACKNVEGMMAAMNIRYNRDEWRLFMDSSMHSIKAVLLHKGKVLPSVPVACAVHKKKHTKTWRKFSAA